MGMFGTGYVWLVMDGVDNLAVVGTYGAGTVLVQGSVQPAKARELDAIAGVETPVAPESSAEEAEYPEEEGEQDVNAIRSRFSGLSSVLGRRGFSTSSIVKADKIPERQSTSGTYATFLSGMGDNARASVEAPRAALDRFKSIHPLLCLSLHPHVYIPDYGIWGKEEYIRNFWGNVDWELVYQRYQKVQTLFRR